METEKIYKHHRTGRVLGGLVVLAVGVGLLLNQMGTLIFPYWVFTWPMFLIALGLYLGARHSFCGYGWLILILIGSGFLAQEVWPGIGIHDYMWPVIIIAVGLFMIIRPRRHHGWDYGDKEYWRNQKWQWKAHYRYGAPAPTPTPEAYSQDDYIDSVSMFGNIHKKVASKDFKGGDIVNIFGGTEIDLTQADIKGRVVLEVVQVFGGTKIIVPSDWEIQSKMVSIFGGIEDKRNPNATKHNPEKVLVIDGTSIFAGIDILSY